MKDLGHLKNFMGMEVAQNGHGMYLCQQKYVLDILSYTGLLRSKQADFPIEWNHQATCGANDLSYDHSA